MSGSATLSEEEKLEMLQDAKDIQRGKVFMAVRTKSQKGTLDEYIDFLSQHIELIEFVSSERITTKLRPLKNVQFCSSSRKTRILNAGIH